MPRAPVLWTCLTVTGLVVSAAVTVACSAVSKVDFTECTDNATCRDAFGNGWVCGDKGLCQQVEQHPRCSKVVPETLFTDPDYADAIIFGSLLDHTPMTGDGLMVNAATLAIEEANKNGLEGRLFGIVHCDYREDQKLDKLTSDQSAIETTKYLVDDLGAVAIIGPGYSSLAEAVYLELKKDDHATPTLVISPSATSDSLTTVDVRSGDQPGLFWRTAPPDSVLGKALAKRMDDEAITDATVIYVSDSYGTGLATNIADNFGGDAELIGFDGVNDPQGQILTIVADVSNKTPGDGVAVVFIGAEVEQVTAFLNAASAYPFYLDDRVKLFLGDAAYNDAVIAQTEAGASDLYDQVRIAFPSVDTTASAYKSFQAAFKVRFPGQDPADASYSSHMYDATWLGVYGVTWAYYRRDQNLSGLNLAFGLQQISADGPETPVLAGKFNAIKTEFQAGRAINLVGASGNLDYNPETEELKDVTPSFFGIDPGGSQPFPKLPDL